MSKSDDYKIVPNLRKGIAYGSGRNSDSVDSKTFYVLSQSFKRLLKGPRVTNPEQMWLVMYRSQNGYDSNATDYNSVSSSSSLLNHISIL